MRYRGVAQSGLARLPWAQKVASSNLAAPTIKKHILGLLAVSLFLSGCATVGPLVTSNEIERARRELKIKAFKFRVEKKLQVTSIGLRILQHLPLEDRKGEYPYLGLIYANINNFLRDIYNLSPYDRGVVILGMVPGFPISESGVKEGDILFKLDGYKINTTNDLASVVRYLKPDRDVILTIKRKGEEGTVTIRPIIIPLNVSFEVVDYESVNASASPGQVTVTQGMLRFIKSEDELAVVLGHEIAHLAKGHILKNIGSGILSSIGGILLGVGAEVLAPGSGGTVSDITGGAFSARFSRDFEREADYFGLKYAYLAGYDIDVGKDIWERFAIEAPRSMTRDLFSTHPSSPERMLRLKKIAQEIKGGSNTAP